MRILISAVNFNEADRMASQRPRALAETLAALGHEVTVLTMETRPNVTAPFPVGVEVIETAPYDEKVSAPVTEIPLGRRLLAGLSVLTSTPAVAVLKRPKLAKLLGFPDSERRKCLLDISQARSRTATAFKAVSEDRKWFRESAPAVQRLARERPAYDVVFATYSTYGSLWLGRLAKSLGLARHMVLDLRDLMNQPERLLSLNLFTRHQQRKAVREADAVTVVSEGLRKNLLEDPALGRFAGKVRVLYNGFLRDELPNSTEMREQSGPLRIVYTGSLYQGRRDASLLFAALREVSDLDPTLRFEVHYAGGAGALFAEMARAQGMEDCVVDHGALNREAAIELQQQADVLLALSWNTAGNEGILTGKFPEYLANGKPIISVVTGDLPGAELTRLVNDLQLGVGVEEASWGEGKRLLRDFLKSAASEAEDGRRVHWNASRDDVSQFDYRTLALQLERLMRGLPMSSLGSSTRTRWHPCRGRLARR